MDKKLISKKKYPHKCKTKNCRGLVFQTSRSNKCSKCRDRQWKKNSPFRYAYNTLKKHAKARGKDFTLSFERFKELAEQTNYIELKGRNSRSLSIDRIDNNRGYHDDNVQAITIRENCRKQFVPYFKNLKDQILETEAKLRQELFNNEPF